MGINEYDDIFAKEDSFNVNIDDYVNFNDVEDVDTEVVKVVEEEAKNCKYQKKLPIKFKS